MRRQSDEYLHRSALIYGANPKDVIMRKNLLKAARDHHTVYVMDAVSGSVIDRA